MLKLSILLNRSGIAHNVLSSNYHKMSYSNKTGNVL